MAALTFFGISACISNDFFMSIPVSLCSLVSLSFAFLDPVTKHGSFIGLLILERDIIVRLYGLQVKPSVAFPY